MRSVLLVLLALTLCACAGGYQGILKEGDDHAESGRYADAEKVYKRALAEDPSRDEASERLTSLHAKWAKAEIRLGDDARKQGRLQDAAGHYKRAGELHPQSGAETSLQVALDEWVEQGRVSAQKNKLEDALTAYQSVLKFQPKHARASELLRAVKLAIAKQKFAEGEQFEKRGRLGNALVAYVRAESLAPGIAQAKERASVVRAKLLDEVTFYVSVSDVGDATKGPEIAEALAPGRLASMMPQGVPSKIVGRPPEGGKGVHVKVKLDNVHVERDRKLLEKVAKFVAGQRMAMNPKFSEWEKKLEQAEKTLEELETDLGYRVAATGKIEAELLEARSLVQRCWQASMISCAEALDSCYRGLTRGAGSDDCSKSSMCTKEACRLFTESVTAKQTAYETERYAMEQARISVLKQRSETKKIRETRLKEPAVSQEPAYAEFPYEVELHIVKVRATMTFDLDPLGSTSADAAPKTQDFLVESQDTTHRGHPLYNVRADLLDLKSEPDLRREAGKKAQEAVLAMVKGELDRYRASLRDAARNSVKRSSTSEDSVELAVRALLVFPDERPDDLSKALASGFALPVPTALYEP